MNAILSVNKTDKNDARGIVNATRTGIFSRVHEKPQEFIDTLYERLFDTARN